MHHIYAVRGAKIQKRRGHDQRNDGIGAALDEDFSLLYDVLHTRKDRIHHFETANLRGIIKKPYICP